LDTGETTFWQALDQFCAKAGLIEAGPNDLPGGGPVPIKPGLGGGGPAAPPKDGAPLAEAPQQAVQLQAAQVQVQVQVQVRGAAQPAQPPQPVPPPGRGGIGFRPGLAFNQITLIDGKPKDLPTAYVGAVRVRALPPNSPVVGAPKREGEILFALQVSPEPKL